MTNTIAGAILVAIPTLAFLWMVYETDGWHGLWGFMVTAGMVVSMGAGIAILLHP